MKHILFGSDTDDLKVAILIKGSALNKTKLFQYYIDPHTDLNKDNFVAFDLEYNDKGKCPAKLAKPCIAELLPTIDDLAIDTIVVCDTAYFKFFTGLRKADGCHGYVTSCSIKGFEHIGIVLCPNYQAMMYNPALQTKIDRALEAVAGNVTGDYIEPGKDIIHSAYYPESIENIGLALEHLREYPELTCDIEAKSLEFWNAGISSIAFAWDERNGIAFGVERSPDDVVDNMLNSSTWHSKEEAQRIKTLLFTFFITYPGKLIYHNIGYDSKVLCYELFMKSLDDYQGMIDGIKALTWKFDDTQLIAYMATNNAVKNELGLKPLSAEFTGDYAEDTKDTTRIPYKELLEYNLKDCLATWYVKKKYEPIMIKDQQQSIYEGLMKDTVVTLMQTELCGMPIDPEAVQEAKRQLTEIVDECRQFFDNSQLIKIFHMGELILKAETKTKEAAARAKTSRATKVYKPEDSVIAYDFNPNSDTQLRRLLYLYLGYPVLDLTDTKMPSCAGKTIKKLLKGHCQDPEHKQMFKYLLKLKDASIILSTFIPAFENAQQLPDGSWRLFGNFNATGTQSLRLSSNNPNLMNIPSGSVFSKLVKKCFKPIDGWLFCGSDFDALEDKTGALLTKDPQRLKIYTEGYCGHCLRTQYYWPEKMPDIDPTSVSSINSIKKLYPDERKDSKAPSFALQYMGTWITLMKNCGFSEEDSKAIEANYHELYKVSDIWLEDIIEKAKEIGYIEMAFGARIRTPLLAKTVGDGRSTPYVALSEGRSAGNAATQSYCVLTLRAFNEFRKRLWESPYKLDVLPSATIHDAIYLLMRNSLKVTKWVNDTLIDCMRWQELDELKHPTIKISSSLEIFWPHWANAIELPNGANEEQIRAICEDAQKGTK